MTPKFSLNVVETEKGKVVAVCDKEILGRSFEEKGVILEVSEKFFGGGEAGEKEVLEALGNCFTGNIVGEEAVSLLIDEGVVEEDRVLKVEGVPTAQIFSV